jgi:hypothetical protein
MKLLAAVDQMAQAGFNYLQWQKKINNSTT